MLEDAGSLRLGVAMPLSCTVRVNGTPPESDETVCCISEMVLLLEVDGLVSETPSQ
jgi:hypothetical protein